MSDTPTPRTDSLMEEWHHCPPTKQLLNHSRQLERELAEAKVEINTWKAVAEARLENFHHYHDESLAYQAKLTAHKAALNLCQMALNADNHETYLELKAEALSEIAKLKGTK